MTTTVLTVLGFVVVFAAVPLLTGWLVRKVFERSRR